MDLSKTHIELVEKVYATLEDNIATVSYTHLTLPTKQAV